jgi:pSer/pThr/pTyr-binding forkhead associated (FHA) protein
LPEPASPRPRARLVVVEGPPGGPYPLGERTTLGRTPGADVLLDHATVARRHATVHWVEGRYWIADEKSHCGTVVNDRGVQRSPLSHGDVVRIGRVTLRFELEG